MGKTHARSKVRQFLHCLLGLIVPSLLLTLPGCSPGTKNTESDTKNGQEATPVTAQPITLKRESVRLESVGTARAIRSVTLYPAVSGKVDQILFEAGQSVKAGDPLLRMDKRDQRLAVELSRINLADAKRLFERYRKSIDSGAVTTATFDDARSASERQRVELARAEVALADRTLRAPFDGIMGISRLDPGAWIDPQTAVTTIDDRSDLYVEFEVPEGFLNGIEQGNIVTMNPWGLPGRTVEGEVVSLDSRVDPGDRTFLVRARINNSDDRLRPGMSFRVTLERLGKNYPQVPEIAVQWGGDGAYVWAVVDKKATRVPVNIVQRGKGRLLVDANMSPGTLVVVEGAQRMREGLPVRILSIQANPVDVTLTKPNGEPALHE